MRQLPRDTWAWRAGLAPDEITYSPMLVDARRGPLTVPATHHWPVLMSQVEAACAARRATGVDVPGALGAAFAHLALVRRTGGYHGFVDACDPHLRELYTGFRASSFRLPQLEEAVRLLEAGEVVERSAKHVGLVRASPPPADDVVRLDETFDALEREAGAGDVSLARALRTVNSHANGLGRQRFNELIRAGRVDVRIRRTPEASQLPLYEVGATTLPTLAGAEDPDGADVRGGFHSEDLSYESTVESLPLLVGASEVTALLLGAHKGSVAVRQATRATGVWLLLAERAQWRTGTVSFPVAELARSLARLFHLNPATDHRTRCKERLAALEAARLIRRNNGSAQVELLLPPRVAAGAVRDSRTQYRVWRATSSEPLDRFDALARRQLLDGVRSSWIDLLERRLLRATVASSERRHRTGMSAVAGSR